MREVNVGHKSLADYRSIVPRELMAEIDELAEGLRGRRVLHVNATAFGGGVAEILYTLVPLTSDAGLEAQWQVITAPPDFFNVTKSFHNGLQGHAVDFPAAARELYTQVCRTNAEALTHPYDFVVIHDPQPLAMRDFVLPVDGHTTHWIWRCHIDTSTPDQALYDYLVPSINRYDAAVYTLREYVPEGLTVPVRPIAPTIDPLAPKNMQLSVEDATYIVRQFGIDVARPLLLQVSRFDPWKDPLGVVDVYRTVKAKHPDVQLALVGAMASDDPEGWHYLERVISYVGDDPDVFILSNLDNVGSVEINAFQSHADVIMQKSTREGFGLTVTEALWKGRPTIGGRVGGIPLQIEDGVTGYLVSSAAECAARCLDVLADPARHRRMALLGKEHVRREFLTPRLLRDELRLFSDLLAGKIEA
ncbi:MAG: glycosyltransferase [Thermoleophilia bacterium]